MIACRRTVIECLQTVIAIRRVSWKQDQLGNSPMAVSGKG
jgi:hypothetical protein